MKALLLFMLRAYQYAIRPLMGANCRFFPSCSDYAREAVERHGAAKGAWLAACRIPVSEVNVTPGVLAWISTDSG